MGRDRAGWGSSLASSSAIDRTFTCAVDNPALFEPMEMLRRYILPAAGALPEVAKP
jgi:hypothetical protein